MIGQEQPKIHRVERGRLVAPLGFVAQRVLINRDGVKGGSTTPTLFGKRGPGVSIVKEVFPRNFRYVGGFIPKRDVHDRVDKARRDYDLFEAYWGTGIDCTERDPKCAVIENLSGVKLFYVSTKTQLPQARNETLYVQTPDRAVLIADNGLFPVSEELYDFFVFNQNLGIYCRLKEDMPDQAKISIVQHNQRLYAANASVLNSHLKTNNIEDVLDFVEDSLWGVWKKDEVSEELVGSLNQRGGR